MASKLVTMRGLAKHLRVQVSTIHAAVAAGRIRAPNSKGLFDVAKASREWRENTDPSKQNRKPKGAESAPSGGGDGRPGSFATARAVRETYQAKLTHLKYQTQAKEVVPVARVKDEWFKIARTLRDAFMNAPDRLSAKAAAMLGMPEADFKLNAIWREEIRLILEELSNAEKRYGLDNSNTSET